jgi:hypothetical protein
VKALVAAHRKAYAEFGDAALLVNRLEWGAPADVEIHFYEHASELACFDPERVAKIKRGDQWAVNCGLDSAIKRYNVLLDTCERIEVELHTTPAETPEDLIALLEWLAEREAEVQCRPNGSESPLEMADRSVLPTLLASVKWIAARAT